MISPWEMTTRCKFRKRAQCSSCALTAPLSANCFSFTGKGMRGASPVMPSLRGTARQRGFTLAEIAQFAERSGFAVQAVLGGLVKRD